MEAVLDDACILVANQKISAVKDLLPVLEKVHAARQPVVIIAEDVEAGVLELGSAFRPRSGRLRCRCHPVRL